ncbi:hypothetical protein AB0M39_04840 [Streptomyces sp. NPDC051907]|uniref:hypothetical protein n=1 Tax=Streptomyces sp. NPDC051907 TaxID=3155284 RepID=UPI003438D5D5
MSAPSLPRRAPGASGRKHTAPEPLPGSPSQALRIRAAGGWEKFMRRADLSQPEETQT